MERLSHLILQEVHYGRWRAFRFRQKGPFLSHLFFADDLVLFAKADEGQIRILEEVFHQFCVCSGQKLSKEKSVVFFSRNVKPHVVKVLGDAMGMKVTNDLGRYLGVPILHRRVTNKIYKYLVDKMKARIIDWSSKRL